MIQNQMETSNSGENSLNEMKKLNKFCIDFLFVKIGKKNQLQLLCNCNEPCVRYTHFSGTLQICCCLIIMSVGGG